MRDTRPYTLDITAERVEEEKTISPVITKRKLFTFELKTILTSLHCFAIALSQQHSRISVYNMQEPVMGLHISPT